MVAFKNTVIACVNMIICVVFAADCVYQDSNSGLTLDLSQLKGKTLIGSGTGNTYNFNISPCQNAIACNNFNGANYTAMVAEINFIDGSCFGYEAFFDSKIEPFYNASGPMPQWQFMYENGPKCTSLGHERETTQVYMNWYCGNETLVTTALGQNQCTFHFEIETQYACSK